MVEAALQELQVETCARRFYTYFNERRFDEAERMVDAEALFSYPGAPACLIGRAGYGDLAHRWAAAFPDGRVTILAVRVHGETAVTELRAEGTHEGLLDLPGLPSLPPTGRHATMTMRETMVVHHGLIASVRMDFDPDELRRLLA